MSVTQKHIQLLRKTGFATVAAAKAGLEAAFTGSTFIEGEAAIAVTEAGEVVLGIKSATSGSTFYNANSVDALVANLQSQIGTLSELDTEAQTSLVAAINELANDIATLDAADIAYTTAATDTVISAATDVEEALQALDAAIDGIKTSEATYAIDEVTENVPETVLHRFQLSKTVGSTTTKSGEFIDINKDSSLVSINYITNPTDQHFENLEYTYIDASGNTRTTYVDMSALIIETQAGSGVTATNGVLHGVVDPASESFLTVGENGFKVSGVQDAINTAESNAKSYTDTEIGKLDATKSGSTTHVSVTVVEEDGKLTSVAVTESDIASASDLTSEANARKAVTGVNADTYTTHATANYISASTVTSLDAADLALDAAVKANADAIAALDAAKVSVSASTETESDKYLSVTTNANETVYTVEVNGIDAAITSAVEALDAAQVGGSGQFLYAISEADGVISASASTLNAAAVAATAISAGNDTVAVSGTTVEEQIASLAETLKDVEDAAYSGVTAGNGIVVTSQTNGDTVAIKLSTGGATSDLLSFNTSDKSLEISNIYDCGSWS